MSTGAKIALGGSILYAGSMVVLVHLNQSSERKRMREGVIKDLERQALTKEQTTTNTTDTTHVQTEHKT